MVGVASRGSISLAYDACLLGADCGVCAFLCWVNFNSETCTLIPHLIVAFLSPVLPQNQTCSTSTSSRTRITTWAG